MNRTLYCLIGLSVFSVAVAHGQEMALDKAGTRITRSTKIKPGQYTLLDPDGQGAVHVVGDNIVVDFQGAELAGAKSGQAPDTFVGRGIVLEGRNLTLRKAKVRGYKVGIHARNCPGLVIEDVDISGNYQQHLRSTPQAEDSGDWMFPHNNDQQKWIDQYGAGLCVESSEEVIIRRVRCRHGQNGIIIDRVNRSRIYDNDCSFLSGWGLAVWRSNRNVISRNAFDFCVRGYSHGVYNRGQDSAGILMFEQNSGNVFAENSVTHGGDGFFGFSGREALGEAPAPTPDFDYRRRGNCDNLLVNNDFSYAPAHGIEMTFGFGNRLIGNRLVGNAICGVWGGYSQDTLIAGNTIEDNGEMGYGLERGGVNIEHGSGNVIEHNTFKNNKCGVHLWSDADEGLVKSPWAKANHKGSTDNKIRYNTFEGDKVGLHLRETTGTEFVSNRMVQVAKEIDADEKSSVEPVHRQIPRWEPPRDYPVYGDARPVGARKDFRGREKIIMTEWGPYDFSECVVFPRKILGADKATLQVLGPSGRFKVTRVRGDVEVSPREGTLPGVLTVSTSKAGMQTFSLDIDAGAKQLTAEGVLLRAQWDVKFFKWEPADDPREHPDRWAALIAGAPIHAEQVASIDYKWGGGPLSPNLPGDHFGTVATTTLELPAGRYRLWTVSDDGIRVSIDGRRVIDDWTWHAPKENTAEVDLSAGRHDVRIDHFEIDGLAQLQFRLEPLP